MFETTNSGGAFSPIFVSPFTAKSETNNDFNDIALHELTEVTNDTIEDTHCEIAPITSFAADSAVYEDVMLFYHGNHLSSTMLVTNYQGAVTQAVAYLPFGQVLTEYKQDWDLDTVIPRFLFSAKELDEESGMYYFDARYLKPPTFISRDKLFEKYFWLSSYVYCANNPLRYIDPDGMDWVEKTDIRGNTEVYYDRKVKSQADVEKKYGKSIAGIGVRHLADGSKVGNGQYTVYNDQKNNKYGIIKDKDGKVINNDRTIIYGKGYTIFAGTTDKSVNAETLHKNLMGTSYTGPKNPQDYNQDDNIDYMPRNPSEYGSIAHDLMYTAASAGGTMDAFTNTDVWKADAHLTLYNIMNTKNPAASPTDRLRSAATAMLFGAITVQKMTKKGVEKILKK